MLSRFTLITLCIVTFGTALWFCQARKNHESNNAARAVIFDMGDVLFETNRMNFAKELGRGDLIRYKIRERIHFDEIKDVLLSRLFEVMYHLGRHQSYDGLYATTKEYELPGLFCEWQKGTIDSATIKKSVLWHIEELNAQEWFHSKIEYEMLKKMVNAMFDPVILAHNMQPIKKGWELLKTCKELGFKIVILSNFDRETWALLKIKYAELFKYVDEIVISGEVGYIKPDPAIYQHVINMLYSKYDICAQNCWFIDDTPNNITAAERLEIHACLCENKKFDGIENQILKDAPLFAIA